MLFIPKRLFTHFSLIQLSFVWFNAGSRSDFFLCTTARQGPICKSQIVWVCVQYVCVLQISPTRHRNAAHMIFLFTRQRHSTSDMYSFAPCWRVASVRKWLLDTTASPSGYRHSLTASWLISSSPCICRHITVRWPENENIHKWSGGGQAYALV